MIINEVTFFEIETGPSPWAEAVQELECESYSAAEIECMR